MIRINENYAKLYSSYLFSEISRRVHKFSESNSDANIIKMGIGDVTKALPAACIEAFGNAVAEMGDEKSFRGYGPDQGYAFLREAAVAAEFAPRGTGIVPDELFISDGAKCDTGNFQELFAADITIAIPDPVYPVYVDTNVMGGRTGQWDGERYEGIVYLESTADNGFVPDPPPAPVDLIYLCFPNNPTGTVATKAQLEKWVMYALEHKALILFDAAYAVFIRDDDIPRSIYEIPEAKQVAVEFRSFSKTAGFTGTRCAYTVVPEECVAYDSKGEKHSVQKMWNRRQTTKFNGVSYPVQRAAEAVYSQAGMSQITALADYYLANAKIIKTAMEDLGYLAVGGEHSPYVWINTGTDSWEFFDLLLKKAKVVCTPGSGFGKCGSGYIRLSAFNDRRKITEGMDRIKEVLADG